MAKKIAALVLVLMLVPSVALGQIWGGKADKAKTMEGTVVKVDKAKKEIVVTTEKGDRTLKTTSTTKGVENAKAGARVTIKYSEKDGQLRASEITLSKASPLSAPPIGPPRG